MKIVLLAKRSSCPPWLEPDRRAVEAALPEIRIPLLSTGSNRSPAHQHLTIGTSECAPGRATRAGEHRLLLQLVDLY